MKLMITVYMEIGEPVQFTEDQGLFGYALPGDTSVDGGLRIYQSIPSDTGSDWKEVFYARQGTWLAVRRTQDPTLGWPKELPDWLK